MPIVSTNDVEVHKQLKIRSANTGLTLGKLIDLYTKLGLQFKAEEWREEDIEKIENLVKELKHGK